MNSVSIKLIILNKEARSRVLSGEGSGAQGGWPPPGCGKLAVLEVGALSMPGALGTVVCGAQHQPLCSLAKWGSHANLSGDPAWSHAAWNPTHGAWTWLCLPVLCRLFHPPVTYTIPHRWAFHLPEPRPFTQKGGVPKPQAATVPKGAGLVNASSYRGVAK